MVRDYGRFDDGRTKPLPLHIPIPARGLTLHVFQCLFSHVRVANPQINPKTRSNHPTQKIKNIKARLPHQTPPPCSAAGRRREDAANCNHARPFSSPHDAGYASQFHWPPPSTRGDGAGDFGLGGLPGSAPEYRQGLCD